MVDCSMTCVVWTRLQDETPLMELDEEVST